MYICREAIAAVLHYSEMRENEAFNVREIEIGTLSHRTREKFRLEILRYLTPRLKFMDRRL